MDLVRMIPFHQHIFLVKNVRLNVSCPMDPHLDIHNGIGQGLKPSVAGGRPKGNDLHLTCWDAGCLGHYAYEVGLIGCSKHGKSHVGYVDSHIDGFGVAAYITGKADAGKKG